MQKLYKFFIKILICSIIFLSLAIISKGNLKYKERIHYELYQRNISFASIKELYHHYLGGISPLEKKESKKEQTVFNEKIKYQKIVPYKNGIALEVTKNYLVPNQTDGIVIYVGSKEEYGNVIIVEDSNKIETWYGNLCNISIKLYDYVTKGDNLGEVCNNQLYIVYKKKNEYLNYEEYFS